MTLKPSKRIITRPVNKENMTFIGLVTARETHTENI